MLGSGSTAAGHPHSHAPLNPLPPTHHRQHTGDGRAGGGGRVAGRAVVALPRHRRPRPRPHLLLRGAALVPHQVLCTAESRRGKGAAPAGAARDRAPRGGRPLPPHLSVHAGRVLQPVPRQERVAGAGGCGVCGQRGAVQPAEQRLPRALRLHPPGAGGRGGGGLLVGALEEGWGWGLYILGLEVLGAAAAGAWAGSRGLARGWLGGLEGLGCWVRRRGGSRGAGGPALLAEIACQSTAA